MILTHEIWVRFLDGNPKCLSSWRRTQKAARQAGAPQSARAHTGIKPHPARGRLFSRPGTGETIRWAARPAETSAARRRQGDEHGRRESAPRACGDDPVQTMSAGGGKACSPRMRG